MYGEKMMDVIRLGYYNLAVFFLIFMMFLSVAQGRIMEENYKNKISYCDLHQKSDEKSECIRGFLEKAEVELEGAYKKLADKISPNGQVKLKNLRAVWGDYKKQQCEFDVLGFQKSEAYQAMLLDCYYYKTKLHLRDIREQLECLEGDDSCGGQ